jgi:hypothetical protein
VVCHGYSRFHISKTWKDLTVQAPTNYSKSKPSTVNNTVESRKALRVRQMKGRSFFSHCSHQRDHLICFLKVRFMGVNFDAFMEPAILNNSQPSKRSVSDQLFSFNFYPSDQIVNCHTWIWRNLLSLRSFAAFCYRKSLSCEIIF